MDKATLAVVKFSFASKEAFAENILGKLESVGFDKVPIMDGEGFLDVIGMVKQVEVIIQEAPMNNIPVPRIIQQEIDWITD